jgi:hypothetical protein
MSDTSFATAAAKVFLERHPSYVVGSHNATLMSKAILRLVDSEGADPANVSTYEQAFQDCLQELELREPDQPKSVEEMSGEELLALSPDKQDRLPTHLFRKLAEYELRQRIQKPVLPEEIAMFKPLFEEQEVAFSAKNLKIVREWLDSRQLGYTDANLSLAIISCEDQLELSEQVLESMSGDEYRKTVVEPAFRKHQAEQPKRPESRVPWGVKFTEFLHNT